MNDNPTQLSAPALPPHPTQPHATRQILEGAIVIERRGDFAAALQHCDAALAKLSTDALRAAASDQVMPGILAEQALLLAATDRSSDAEATLSALAHGYPSYALLDAARLRVELLLAVRRGDLAAAAALAERAADLSIPARVELLADLARAVAHPDAAGAGEVDRLRRELKLDAESRRWIEIVSPTLVQAFLGTFEVATIEDEGPP